MREAPLKTAGYNQGLHSSSTTAKERIGTLRVLEDGRKFRYVKAGGALAAGKMTIAAAIDADHDDAAVTAINTNRTQVKVTVTAGTAIAENALAGGWLVVNDATLEGKMYRIESNTAIASDGTIVYLTLTDRLGAYDSTTQVTLVHNPFSGVTHSATEESMPAGVAVAAIADGSYGWVQTGGPGVCLMDGTPAVGSMLTLGSVAGSLAAINTTLDIDQPICAIKWGRAGVDTEYDPVFLKID